MLMEMNSRQVIGMAQEYLLMNLFWKLLLKLHLMGKKQNKTNNIAVPVYSDFI